MPRHCTPEETWLQTWPLGPGSAVDLLDIGEPYFVILTVSHMALIILLHTHSIIWSHNGEFPFVGRTDHLRNHAANLNEGFHVFLASIKKNLIFWDMPLLSPFKFNRRFGAKYGLHLHGRKIRQAWKQVALFLRNVGWHTVDYITLCPGRRKFFNLN
jgi:hypothetical protein